MKFVYKNWSDYSFSFDFYLTDSGFVSFSLYIDTNNDDTDHNYFSSRNPWALEIKSNGKLLYTTLFDQGTYYIIDDANDLKCLNINNWNHVDLKLNGNELSIYLNDEKIGSLTEQLNENRGRVSIGGDVGCKFDNLKVYLT